MDHWLWGHPQPESAHCQCEPSKPPTITWRGHPCTLWSQHGPAPDTQEMEPITLTLGNSICMVLRTQSVTPLLAASAPEGHLRLLPLLCCYATSLPEKFLPTPIPCPLASTPQKDTQNSSDWGKWEPHH